MKLNIVVFVIVLLGLNACVKEVSQPIEPAVLKKLKLIPAEPQIIIYYNHKKIKSSQYWSNLIQESISPRLHRKTIFDSLGLDFNKDIEEIIVASEWDGANTFIITVKDTAGLQKKFYNFRHKFYYEFVDSKIIFITNDAERIKLIKLGENDNNFFKNPNFRRIINSILYKEHFWLYSSNPNFILKLTADSTLKNEELQNLFKSIKFLNFSLRLDKDVSIGSHWECTDSEKAELLRGVLNGFISALALTYPEDPFVQELSAMDVYVENSGVNTVLKFSSKKIERLRKSGISKILNQMVEHGR